MIVVREATRDDIAAFSDMADKPTVRAWCGELDGKIIALGGFALRGGRWIMFCDLTDEARPHKMTLMRTAKRVLGEARRMGLRFVYAEANPNEPGAVRWLQSLGFEVDPRSAYYYRWEANG